jgi:hypothetical protein
MFGDLTNEVPIRMLLRFYLDDNESPGGRYSLMNTTTTQYINAGESVVIWVEWNFDSRSYPDTPGAQNVVTSVLANDKHFIHYGTNNPKGVPDWPGE